MQEISSKDNEIIELFGQSNQKEKAFNTLVNLYKERLYWHIRKMVIDHDDTDDILQNVFVKVWKSLDSFREESSLFTWLYRIATNECITFLNKKRKRFFIPIHDVESELIAKLDTQNVETGDEMELKLQKAILKLPQKQRIVFNMKYFEEMKYEEMSEILGTSVGALKASYHHAVKKIEQYVQEF